MAGWLLWCLLLRSHGLITQPTGFRDGGVRGGRKARTQTVVLFFHVPKTGVVCSMCHFK